MASKPGILTNWPWKSLGKFKYLVLAPQVFFSIHSYVTATDKNQRDLFNFLILPILLWRMLHTQIWISLSRYQTAKGRTRILDRTIDFEQVDRERDWDDQILFNRLLFYLASKYLPGTSHLPIWRSDGAILIMLLHVGPVEFLYYWLHRALHHHFLYSRYHSHHHSSIVTEPITSVIHPFAEHISYFLLFAIPMVTSMITGVGSVGGIFMYLTYIDFMNNMGHCNFEFIPNWLFSVLPPLKYLMYTPSFHSLHHTQFRTNYSLFMPFYDYINWFHSLHHTQFRTNYSLFMPFYDYIYGTMDKTTDTLYKKSLERQEDTPDVVHLTHLTTPESVYHLRLGFASLASNPHASKWYLWILWPVTLWSMMLTWLYGRTFVTERNQLKNIKLQTRTIPKYSVQYFLQRQRESINSLIEEAISEAEEKGSKVLTLGLLNQSDELNGNGEIYLDKYPKLKVKIVDGSSLAVALVLHTIPKGTKQVLLRGNISKSAFSIAFALCQLGIQVVTLHENEYQKLKSWLNADCAANLILSTTYSTKVWLVGDGLLEDEQLKAPKGTLFIPFSKLPPKKLRKDCFYHSTPAMIAPKSLENVDSCENWLPRRVMSVWRVAGIVHALEGWKEHECGRKMFDTNKVWEATLRHGFQPLTIAA